MWEAVDVVAGFDGEALENGRSFGVVGWSGRAGVQQEEEERDHGGLEEDDDAPAEPC